MLHRRISYADWFALKGEKTRAKLDPVDDISHIIIIAHAVNARQSVVPIAVSRGQTRAALFIRRQELLSSGLTSL